MTCASLIVFAIAQRIGVDRPWAIALFGLTTWVFLPVYAVAGYAWAARRKAIGALALLVIALHGWLAWPDLRLPARTPGSAASAPRLRVFSSNVYYLNKDLNPIIEEFLASDADVGVFVEANEPHRWALDDPRIRRQFPHRADSPIRTGNVVVSRFAISNVREFTFGEKVNIAVTIDSRAGPIELIPVHTSAPVNQRNIGRWHAEFAALRGLAGERKLPTIFVGDFNATVHHRPLRSLLALGFTDAQSARGRGLRATYPSDSAMGPVLRIDHVLTSPEIVPLGVRLGKGAGSDHKPIVATLALIGPR